MPAAVLTYAVAILALSAWVGGFSAVLIYAADHGRKES